MSEDNKNLPVVVEEKEKVTDLTSKQLEKVHKFIEEGMPGLGKIDEFKMRQIMDLYLSGKTYSDIANITRTQKTAILYLSYKFEWPLVRRDYLVELESNMKSRVINSKTESQAFMLNLIHMWQTKITNQVNAYLATNDSMANAIDLKEIDKYLKTVEMLQSISNDNKGHKSPLVGINTGDGVTVKKTGENSIEITPNNAKEKSIESILKQLADSRRNEEKMSKLAKTPDIVKVETKKQGEPINEND